MCVYEPLRVSGGHLDLTINGKHKKKKGRPTRAAAVLQRRRATAESWRWKRGDAAVDIAVVSVTWGKERVCTVIPNQENQRRCVKKNM